MAAPVVLRTSNPGTLKRAFGGVARNVACNLAKLGVDVALLSAVGADDSGEALLRDAEARGVDCALVLRLDEPTSSYIATLDHEGELVVAVAAMAIADRLTPECIRAREAELAAAGLIFADANLPQTSVFALGEMAATKAIPLVLDPVSTRKAPRMRPLLEAALPIFLLALNRDELAVLAEQETGEGRGLEAACDRLLGRGVENLLVGLGPSGVFLAGRDGHRCRIASRAGPVQDVTGAGDSAIAATLWAWRAGYDLVRAAQAGQIAAGLTVASCETVSPKLDARVLTQALAELEKVAS